MPGLWANYCPSDEAVCLASGYSNSLYPYVGEELSHIVHGVIVPHHKHNLF